MQKQGFFCQLPFDPSHTEIGASLSPSFSRWRRVELTLLLSLAECIRINKIIARQS